MRTWILGALALLALGTTVLSCGGDRSPNTAANSRPNIVFILTDDQTHESLRVMTRTKALLADEGTTFSNAIISYPLCCPSRATLLTGQYAHNHGVLENVPPQGGVEALDATETLAVWLERAGYATSHIGKYLNEYGAKDRKEAEKLVAVGDPMVIDQGVLDLPNGRLAGRAFDDRAGAFVVLETARQLARLKPKAEIHAVGTVQEEIGSRGATTSTFGIAP